MPSFSPHPLHKPFFLQPFQMPLVDAALRVGAARRPKHIRKLVLIGASGLFVEGALIGDIF